MTMWSTLLKSAAHGKYGAARGETVTTLHAESGGDVTIAVHQEVDHLLKANRELKRDAEYTGDFQEGWGQRVARIPLTVINKWLFEEGFDAMKPGAMPEVLRRLDDPEYCDLKVVDERVSRFGPKRSFLRASTASPGIIIPGKDRLTDA